MTYWLVVWIGYACPIGLGWLPLQLRPAICSERLQFELTSYRATAERRIQGLGPGATVLLLEVKGGRTRERAVSWDAAVK